MSYQEPIDCGDKYGFLAESMVELINQYQQENFHYQERLASSVSSFLEKVASGLNDHASLEEIAHYRLACDALVRYTGMSTDEARGTLTELVSTVPDLFYDPSAAVEHLDLSQIQNFFKSLARLSTENYNHSQITGKKSKYRY